MRTLPVVKPVAYSAIMRLLQGFFCFTCEDPGPALWCILKSNITPPFPCHTPLPYALETTP